MRTRSINLIPFSGSAAVNGRIDLSEPFYNFLAFVPLGLYLSILGLPKKTWQRVLVGLAASLAFETIQYVFGIGASDITDIITNTAGTAAGVFAFELLFSKRREKAGAPVALVLLILEVFAVFAYGVLLGMQ